MATIEIRDVLDNETGETIFPRTHVKAVIGLVDSSFFEEYTDGSGTKSVRLRAEYAGLWADGWISAGGIGTGGGGGGGSTHLKTLLDVYHSSSSVLRADGTPVQNGDALVYDGNNSRWYAAPVSGGGGQIQPATAATLGGVKVGSVISTPTINPVSAVGGRYYYLQTDSNGLAFVNVPWEGGGGSGGAVNSVTVGDVNYQPTAGVVTIPAYPTTLPASDVPSWAKQPTKPSYAFSELTSHPTTLSGYGITDAKIESGTITLGGNSITPLTSFTEEDPTVPSWAKQSSLQFSALPDMYVGSTQVRGTKAVQAFTGVSSIKATLDTNAETDSLIEWDANRGAWRFHGNLYADGYITACGVGSGGGGYTLPIASATVLGGIKVGSGLSIDSEGVLSATGGGGGGGSVSSVGLSMPTQFSVSHSPVTGSDTIIVTLKSTYTIPTSQDWSALNLAAHTHSNYDLLESITAERVAQWDSGSGGSGTVTLVKVGQTSYSPDSNGIVSLPAYPTSLPASDVSAWAKAASKPSYTFSEIGSKPSTISGYGITDAKISNGVITLGGNTITPLTSSSVYGLTLQSGSFSGGTYNPASGSGSFNIPTTLDHVSDGTSRKLSDYVTKAGAETISGAKTFSANTKFSANLSVASNKHIDLGPIRIEYDSTYNALRITSNDGTTVNFYCDGFVTAGGVNNN